MTGYLVRIRLEFDVAGSLGSGCATRRRAECATLRLTESRQYDRLFDTSDERSTVRHHRRRASQGLIDKCEDRQLGVTNLSTDWIKSKIHRWLEGPANEAVGARNRKFSNFPACRISRCASVMS